MQGMWIVLARYFRLKTGVLAKKPRIEAFPPNRAYPQNTGSPGNAGPWTNDLPRSLVITGHESMVRPGFRVVFEWFPKVIPEVQLATSHHIQWSYQDGASLGQEKQSHERGGNGFLAAYGADTSKGRSD